MVSSESESVTFKVVMLGESGVGKTCIVNRYMQGAYITSEPTIGSSFSSKTELIKLDGAS